MAQLKKMHNTPLVHVSAEGDWSADFDAMVTYTTLQPFPSSAWDWIGLYKVWDLIAPFFLKGTLGNVFRVNLSAS